jgi:hypothetical protein
MTAGWWGSPRRAGHKVVLQPRMAELEVRAGLAENAAPVAVRENADTSLGSLPVSAP